MHQYSIRQLQQGLADKAFSSVELTRHYLQRINTLDPQLNSFITTTADIALAQAEAADRQRAAGQAGPLCGIPIAHKDIFCTTGVRTSCASKMLDNFIAPYNATLVEKLAGAGTVMLGKTNMDEFAMGSSNETSFYGPVNNPWDTTRVPGGSSGGSAAAVAAQLAVAATASDTGGSIRQPAALCGLTGFKPTYGMVSRYGMIAFASSLDQAGTLTRNAEDAALLMNAMAGLDERDSTSLANPCGDFVAGLARPLAGLRIGLPKEFFAADLDSRIGTLIQAAIDTLQNAGATVREVSLPHSELSVAAYYVIAPAEASANLSRFDGVRYGYRCQNPADLQDLYTRTRAEGFGEEVKRRILVGSYALSAGFYDAYYNQALKIRRLIKNDFIEAFRDVDLILGPTAPATAFRLGEKTDDPVQMYLQDIYTIAVNLAGLPAIS
ncbi:MAG TPA: Asp-tRNA(Asn)/Glu-tRNA(Gln) amidotransferase subunit GatA, partial [Pseudomonadales bacterium]